MIQNAIGIGEGDLVFARPTSVSISSGIATLNGVARKPLAVLHADTNYHKSAAYIEDGQGNVIENYFADVRTTTDPMTVTFNGPSHTLTLNPNLARAFSSTSVNDYLFIYR